MLVISRRKNEGLVFGDDIEVTVVEIRGDKVRLGIKTPADVPVHRQEVYEAIKRAAEQPLRNDRSMEAVVEREPLQLPHSLAAPPVVASPATITLSGVAITQLDDLRRSAELSREAALETMLHVIDRAAVGSLCDLERRLRRG